MSINQKYNYKTTPLANEASIVRGDKYRFTVLTSRLVRIEYNENGIFEDRATQTVINRAFAPVDFTVTDTDGILRITTDDIMIIYTKEPFSRNSLSVRYVGKNSKVLAGTGQAGDWYFGDANSRDLRGTTRTLDGVNGKCELGDGIMSRGSINVLDDSKSLVITEDGWVEARTGDFIDQYLFCYGMPDINTRYLGATYDYLNCLKAFYELTGKTPLIPRFALGNWWSRYYAYTQDEYNDLMLRFKKEDIPFSVSVIDMDWHKVTIDPKYGTGWTGFSWETNLFPDHKEFLEFLHNEGYKVTLNLHPQEGIAAHEEQYPKMAEALGLNPEEEKTIEFNIADPEFLENYFDIMLHPHEEEGVDFWWMDWQQGNTTRIPNLDPLWMLNHFHYLDNARDGKRPLAFSRYSGPGSHRYPIGFSGDSVISWDSLDFQPYFTASASNIGYGWWSHDIGGHMMGKRDEELTARWVQLGTFSPINRLHSGCSLFMGKEPWKYNKITEISMKKFLKLRHELIPYLYTMNLRAHEYGEPLVQPLYYRCSGPEAFRHKNEFFFGTEMLVAPITRPHDEVTDLGSSDVYLPEGKWYDFFTNLRYSGGRAFTAYRDLYEMPVFVKAGGIVPMAKLTHTNDVENPENMKIKVYAGADGEFELYEDDGYTTQYENGKFAVTKMIYSQSEKPSFTICRPSGDSSVIPSVRNYEIEIIGLEKCMDITVTENGRKCDCSYNFLDGVLYINAKNISGELKVEYSKAVSLIPNNIEKPLMKLIEHARMNYDFKDEIFHSLTDKKKSTAQRLAHLFEYSFSEVYYPAFTLDTNFKNALAEIVGAEL